MADPRNMLQATFEPLKRYAHYGDSMSDIPPTSEVLKALDSH